MLPDSAGQRAAHPRGSRPARRRAGAQKLDFAMLTHAIGVVETLVREKRRLLVTVPVRFETLCVGAHRRRYIELLRTRLSSEAASLLVIELVEACPTACRKARLIEIEAALARACPRCRRAAQGRHHRFQPVRRCAHRCRWLRSRRATRLRIGADAAHGALRPRRGESRRRDLFARHRQPPAWPRRAGAGFSHLDGDAVAAIVDEPRGISSVQPPRSLQSTRAAR